LNHFAFTFLILPLNVIAIGFHLVIAVNTVVETKSISPLYLSAAFKIQRTN